MRLEPLISHTGIPQILSHIFYNWKLCELFLLSGFLICHAVGWYIELKNQKLWWRIPERKILISGYPKDLYLYWIPKLHKTPYKERHIAGSSTCSTKELSIHLTKILSAVKEGQQKYCETVSCFTFMNFVWKICSFVA
jgi:hypothetical protein